MKKEAIAVGLILISIFLVHALLLELTHESSEVIIKTNGNSMTLKEAVQNNYLVDEYPRSANSLTSSITKGHNAEEIIVEVEGGIKTLQEAIDSVEPNSNSNKGLCSSTQHRYGENSLPEGYTYGHLATNIYISGDKTLQQAIDEGDFCDHFTYQFKTGVWGACSNSCGEGINERTIWCERSDGTKVDDSYCLCTTDNKIIDKSYCVNESDKPSTTQSCDGGSSTCGWSGWSQTGSCSTGCGTGSYRRTRTCQVAGHCAGSSQDYGGSSCTVYSSCGYQYITLHSRTTDTSSQCSSYWWKAWWWIRGAGGSYINPCTYRLGSQWSFSSASPLYSSGGRYWCDVTCVARLPSTGTASGGTYDISSTSPEQCVDYGWKWNINNCPGGYSIYEYEIIDYSRNICRGNCIYNGYR